MKRLTHITLTAIALLLVAAGTSAATTISVAVATNFLLPLENLAAAFERESGIKIQRSGASTGKLYAQIKNGAPYDIFLAADAQRPQLLYEDGLAEKPQTYARGRVVLWSKDQTNTAATWQQALAKQPTLIAIANPEVAPYGLAAAKALKETGLWDLVRPQLVYAQSAGQAFQYAERGATTFSFAALSYATSPTGENGKIWSIPQAPEVEQKGCILKKSRNPQAARKFFDFLLTPAARKITAAYEYR